MNLKTAFALFVSTITIDSRFDLVASSASIFDEADPPTTRKTKNAKKDSKTSSGGTGQLGNSTFGSTKLRCPGKSDNYDCVACKRPADIGTCNSFYFMHTPSFGYDMWASKVIDFDGGGFTCTKPTLDNIMGTDGQIQVQRYRHDTPAAAKSFKLKSENSKPYGLLHHDSHGAKYPDTLNFWVTVDLTYTSDGVQTATIEDVTLGQGSKNDWWIISPNCAWFDKKYRCKALGSNYYTYLIFSPYKPSLWVNNNKVLVEYFG